MDNNCRYIANKIIFPNGITGVADKAHSLGLKFGIHVMRGIPRKERVSSFSKDEKYTFITLRALSASPLIMGGDLPTSDQSSFDLLTNKKMLACNQNGIVGKLLSAKDGIEIWKTCKE